METRAQVLQKLKDHRPCFSSKYGLKRLGLFGSCATETQADNSDIDIISERFRKSHPKVLWKSIAGMRGKLIHGYFGVNVDIVWRVMREDLSQLIDQISQILSNFQQR